MLILFFRNNALVDYIKYKNKDSKINFDHINYKQNKKEPMQHTFCKNRTILYYGTTFVYNGWKFSKIYIQSCSSKVLKYHDMLCLRYDWNLRFSCCYRFRFYVFVAKRSRLPCVTGMQQTRFTGKLSRLYREAGYHKWQHRRFSNGCETPASWHQNRILEARTRSPSKFHIHLRQTKQTDLQTQPFGSDISSRSNITVKLTSKYQFQKHWRE